MYCRLQLIFGKLDKLECELVLIGNAGKSTANDRSECWTQFARTFPPSCRFRPPLLCRARALLPSASPTTCARRPPDRLFASAAERPGAIPEALIEDLPDQPSLSQLLPSEPTDKTSSSLVSGSTPRFPITGRTTFPPTPYTRPSDDGNPPSSARADAAPKTKDGRRSQ